MQMLHQHTTKMKNTTQQITDQSLSLVSVVKLWNMSLQNTYLTIWKATIYYMIFNMVSDILDPVKLNYCPLFKNLPQITDLIIMDYPKAFDKVRLLYKLKFYGIKNQTLHWISTFSSNRIQTVVLDGESSV
jgi:ABC-type transport system involved in Fe-S cluster assembly fused permease/ATPase subunit